MKLVKKRVPNALSMYSEWTRANKDIFQNLPVSQIAQGKRWVYLQGIAKKEDPAASTCKLHILDATTLHKKAKRLH